ncbi:MAG TPA: EAL domain-containing protein [Myxococcales bacterium LLY-WYZ-16_1]|nr:EAL domain-containing protein [Myxococcales bacterium LLY-WYZ-16_1]
MLDEAPQTILLLEDNDADALYVDEMLEARPPAPRLVRACGVREAIETCRSERPDLALLDLNVSDSFGLATLQAFQGAIPGIPVVVLSGQSDMGVATEAVASGAQDYLVKGRFDSELLHRSMRHARSRFELSRRLRESEERYTLALAGSHDGIWDWNLDADRLFVSERWKEMLGFGASDCFERIDDWFALVYPKDLPRLRTALEQHRVGKTEALEIEVRVRSRGGGLRWILTRGAAVRDVRGRVRRMAGSLTDITRYKEAEARLRYDAYHDRLTGLPNRALLVDRLQQAIHRSSRYPDRGFALLFIDLDRFKLVNDSMGHAVGDRFLVSFVERILPLLRPTDTFARLGGDEFCILLEEAGEHGDAELVAERLHKALREPLEVNGQVLFASASIGITDSDHPYRSPEEILRDADIAMYRAKERSRGTSGRFDGPEHSALVERFQMENELRFALHNGELDLQYQPIVDIQTGDLDGYEALLRWRSPSRGVVGPDTFIPIAEEIGLLSSLGRWTIDAAAQAVAALTRQHGTRWSVSVNLSPREFLEPDLVDHINEVLGRTRLVASQLILEVTENVLLHHGSAAEQNFEALKRLGVSIDLDDFGTGFSSLSHLRQFPVDRLKIDRSFIRDMLQRKEDREIVRAIVALGRTLGKQVVAEGVETRAQRQMLAALGCVYGQGFLFAAPGRLRPFSAA